MSDPVTIAKQPTREDAALGLHVIHAYLAASRLVWKRERPKTPGYYWFRDDRSAYPLVVNVRQDWSEKSIPLVVQEYRPENRGVEYLASAIYDGAQWAGPLETPDEQ